MSEENNHKLDHLLNEIESLTHEYRHKVEAAVEDEKHSVHHDRLHHLLELIEGLQEQRLRKQHTQEENQREFLRHHLEVVQHINHHAEYLAEEEVAELEIEALHKLVHELREHIERQELEERERQHNSHNTYQGPSPNPYAAHLERK